LQDYTKITQAIFVKKIGGKVAHRPEKKPQKWILVVNPDLVVGFWLR